MELNLDGSRPGDGMDSRKNEWEKIWKRKSQEERFEGVGKRKRLEFEWMRERTREVRFWTQKNGAKDWELHRMIMGKMVWK
jgi:hypothetical protein